MGAAGVGPAWSGARYAAARPRARSGRSPTSRSRSCSSRRSSPPPAQIVGAEALARWDGARSPEQLFARAAAAGLSERLSRLIQRKALRIAAAWEGPLERPRVSINLLPEDLARPGYERLAARRDCAPPASIPSGSRSRSPKARCSPTATRRRPAGRLRDAGRHDRASTISAPAMRASPISTSAAARHAQDRPRPDRRHRRRQRATGSWSRR